MVRLLALSVVLAAAPASAAVAPAVAAPSFEASVAAGLKAIKAAAPKWTSVGMTVTSSPAFVMITEPSLQIDVNGSGGAGSAWFSGRAGNESVSFSATAFGSGWSLMGSGVNISMSRFGGGWSVWGTVGKTAVSYTIDRFGSGLTVFGQSGASVTVSGWSTSLQAFGRIDEERFDRKALAVMGATLALAAPASK